jgi:putative sigma-54 modulation protein
MHKRSFSSTYPIEVHMSRKTVAEKFHEDVYDITVTGRNVLVTDAMEQYAIEKISSIDRFSNRMIGVNVVMDIQKLEHKVDIVMKVEHIVVRSSASSDNMYASIDKAVDRLKAQIRKFKGRIHEHQAKGVSSVEMNVKVVAPLEEELNALNDEIVSETNAALINKYTPHRIVTQETKPLKTLNYNEALMKIELSGDNFLIFRAEEDKKLKVIYRRADDNFGIIEPEK